jgi:hypothetical protein
MPPEATEVPLAVAWTSHMFPPVPEYHGVHGSTG